MTAKTDRLLRAIIDHTKLYGYPPAVRELAKVLGLSVSTVHHHLERAKLDGKISWVPGRSRTIRIVEEE